MEEYVIVLYVKTAQASLILNIMVDTIEPAWHCLIWYKQPQPTIYNSYQKRN
jgi:hypothetical protein